MPNPLAYPCPIGLHCPRGSGQPVPCQPGFFANFSQAADCMVCPAGYYCEPEEVVAGNFRCTYRACVQACIYYFIVCAGNSESGHNLCLPGFYCPTGTGRNMSACPAGTFSDEYGLQEEAECQACTGGMYCDRSNLTAPAGHCSPGE